jgi:trehalose-phosphatase
LERSATLNNGHLPRALESLPAIRASIGLRKPAFFLDLGGTLAPVVSYSNLVKVPPRTREVLASLARNHVVCVLSGLGLADLRLRVGLDDVYYAADHGYRILGPPGSAIDLEIGPEDRHELEAAVYELERRLRLVKGAVVETKGVSVSVHYRLVSERERPLVDEIVAEVAESAPGIRLTSGKLIHELRPDVPWGKGRAMLWLLKRLRLERRDVCPICLGDDPSDEDMFAVAGHRGVSVVVGNPDRATQASYQLLDFDEAATFLRTFVTWAMQRSPALAGLGREALRLSSA